MSVIEEKKIQKFAPAAITAVDTAPVGAAVATYQLLSILLST
jgi:hypothetical protein